MARRKRKFKKNIVKFFLSIILVALVSYLSYQGYNHFFGNGISDVNGNTNVNNNHGNKHNENKEQIYKLKLLATGDGLIHSVIYRSYYKNGVYDFSDAVKYVKDIVKEYDIAYYNQETPTGDDSIAYSGYPMFYTPSAYVDAMRAVGFNTVSLASNHSLDKGEKGILNTVKYFKTTDILYSGMSDSETDRNNFIIKEKNNITYTMLSYTTITNGLNVPAGKSYLLNKYDKEQVKKDIEAVRDKVDVLIAAMHWGTEYEFTPNKYQEDMAKFLSDNGVDIIIGTHPHVIQPITYINNTLVIYSLGNFISAHEVVNTANRVGLMVSLDIEKDSTTSKISINNLESELLYTYYTSNYTDFKVIPFSMIDSNYLSNYKEVYTKYSDIVKSIDNNIKVKELNNAS